MKRICVWSVTVILLVFSVANLLAPDYDFGEYMLYALTLGALAYAVFYRRAEAFFCRGWGRAARWVMRGALLSLVGIIAFLAFMGNTDTATGTERVLIVLGAPLLENAKPSRILQERLSAAESFLKMYAEIPALLTGGQVPGEAASEAETMRAYLTGAGIGQERLWLEAQSLNTKENFRYSMTLVKHYGLTEDDPVAILTNSFHCYRSRKYAESAGFRNINILPCYVGWVDCPTWYLREAVSIFYFWLTGKGK